MLRIAFATLLIWLSVLGCSTQSKVQVPPHKPERTGPIAAGECVIILVQDLQVRRQVNSAGFIEMPLLPRPVHAEGLTLAELASSIKDAYKPDGPRVVVVTRCSD